MPYEDNVFPHTSGSANNHYGRKGTEDGVVSGGELHGAGGSIFEKVVYFTYEDFGSDFTFDTQLVIPAGSRPIEAVFEIGTAITQTGGTTSTTLYVGTAGSEDTNGFSISDAATSLAAVANEADTSGAGTWAAVLAADTTVGLAVVEGGGTITSIDGGEGKIIIRYSKV